MWFASRCRRRLTVSKATLGAISVLISAFAYGIYISQTIRNEDVQPHQFLWLLWGFVSDVAALVQWTKGAGAGTWVTAFTAFVCFIIGVLTLLKHSWRFSRFDWLCLAIGIIVVAFDVIAKNTTTSAVFATGAGLVGYYYTIKKGWSSPYTDSATSFALNSAKFIPALFALRMNTSSQHGYFPSHWLLSMPILQSFYLYGVAR